MAYILLGWTEKKKKEKLNKREGLEINLNGRLNWVDFGAKSPLWLRGKLGLSPLLKMINTIMVM